MSCLFCTSENVKKRTIISNYTAFAFLTNIPITPGHTLVCPKRCVAKIDDLDYYELKDLYELVLKVKDALVKTYGAEGFNCAWNEGTAGGQNIEH
ncbi:MAG: HIT domain-containing protein [Candidatus Micrarchaeota archaeon]